MFVADVHRTQQGWIAEPGLHGPPPKPGRGRPAKRRQATTKSVTVDALAKTFGAADWTRCILRDSTRGELRVDIAHRRVWLWDSEEATARCWHLIVRREVGSPKTIKYTVCNAPADTPLLQMAQMQGQRYWVERTFEDAKGECGLADYQVLGWRAWHHHVTMVMLAMLFIAEQRGVIQSIPEIAATTDHLVFLDISRRVFSPSSGGHDEEGLLGLAFHPDYRRNRQFFVYYSAREGPTGRRSIS